MFGLQRLAHEEDGAVTVDLVALVAAIVCLGLIAICAIGPALEDLISPAEQEAKE